MIKKGLLVFLVLFSSVAVAASSGKKFIAGFEAIPLMDGFSQREDATTFDSPEGRFIEAYIESVTVSEKEALAFYQETLPQLGWKKTGDGTFERDGEQLLLDVANDEAPLVIRFVLNSE